MFFADKEYVLRVLVRAFTIVQHEVNPAAESIAKLILLIIAKIQTSIVSIQNKLQISLVIMIQPELE